MASDWDLIKDYVKSLFKDHLSVPTISDILLYQLLHFLILKNGTSFKDVKWYEKPLRWYLKPSPSFDSVGEIHNFAAPHPQGDGSLASLPEIHVEDLCILGGHAWNKTVYEGEVAKNRPQNIGGRTKTKTLLPCLGTVRLHTVKYRDLRTWIEHFLISDEDMISEAKRGNLFIICETIMAEKLSSNGKKEQSRSGRITPLLNLNYESKSSSNLERPPEFGQYPIAFKIGQIKVRRLKHAAHASAMTRPTAESSTPSSSTTGKGIYRLKIEPLRDFSQSYSKRKFGKENSPSSDDSLSPPTKVSKRNEKDGSGGKSEPKARKCLAKLLA